MRKIQLLCLLLFTFLVSAIFAQQKVIQLYNGAPPGSENWDWNEKELENNAWQTKIVYNVSRPTLTVFSPDSTASNGTAIVICPGGAFHALSINSEGNDVAKWLVKRGVTCFVLKYRIARSLTDDPIGEMMGKWGKKEFNDENNAVIPLGIADGREAIKYVRDHAAEYDINPKQIGIIGFSAGGTVVAGTAFNYTAENRPDFVAPIYPYMPDSLQGNIAADEPPMFLAAASDDGLGLHAHTAGLYNKWSSAKIPVEMHLYVKGGHGFGMRTQNIPTDNWIERFGDWLSVQGFLKPAKGWMAQLTPQQIEEFKRKRDEQIRTDWAFMKRYADENKNINMSSNEQRVVFMGNSITQGWKEIDSAYFAAHPNYIDRGISGQTTPQMLVRFRQDVIDLKPAVVVILAGINDIAQNTGPMTLEQTFGNIVSMAELAKANNIRVVISSVLPAYDFPWSPGLQPAEKVVKLNAMLKDYANENNIVYLDYFSAMADERKGLPKSLSEDGVHPNLEGYRMMEPLAEKAIEEALKSK